MQQDEGKEEHSGRSSNARVDTSAAVIVERAREQLGQLVGRSAEAVTSLERHGDGWRVEVEVVELDRIPATTSVLATYEAELDRDGALLKYERVRRYMRSQADLT